MNAFEIISVLSVGYLVGAIPFAVIIAKAKGVNIFEAGSGNPGATNVKRAVGKHAGNLCFVLDALKGFVAAGWPLLPELGASRPVALGIIGLLAAILGHSFSVFIRFRGGKGVAAAMGGLLALMPWVLLIGVVLWLLVFFASRYVSLASIVFGLSLPFSSLVLREPRESFALGCIFAVLIVVRHRSNIRRLMAGTENRFEKKR